MAKSEVFPTDVTCLMVCEPEESKRREHRKQKEKERERERERLPFSAGNVSLALTALGETRNTLTHSGVGFGIMNEIPPGGSGLWGA